MYVQKNIFSKTMLNTARLAGGAVVAARDPPRGAAGPLQALLRPVRRPLQLLRPPLHQVRFDLAQSVLKVVV